MTDILFLPVSGPTGYGEYARCLIIAEGLKRSDPGLQIHFGISASAPYLEQCPWPTHRLADTPTRDTPGVHSLLAELKPRLVIFDSCGRSHQYRTAQSLGIKVGFISSRPASRRRVFSLSRIGKIDIALLIGDPATQPPGLGILERFKTFLFGRRLQLIHTGPIFLPADSEKSRRLRHEHAEGFALFVPGGGGTGDESTLQAFENAALEFARSTGAPTKLVLGPNRSAQAEHSNTPENFDSLSTLPPAEFINLLAAARIAVVGGGSVLSQSFALGIPSIGVALGASDQQLRVNGLSQYPGVIAGSRDAPLLARAAITLWEANKNQTLPPPMPPGLTPVVEAVRALLR